MDLKKNPQVNLEKKHFTNFIVGIIVTLSMILISFEWTTPADIKSDVSAATEIDYDMEEMIAIPREESKPAIKNNLPAIDRVIEIVADDIEIEDVDFSSEVTGDTRYSFQNYDFDSDENIVEDPIPFVQVEEKPLFNGEDPNTAFAKYIARNLIYPEIAARNGVHGRVIVQFVIDEKGSLTNPVILRSVDPALDAEALRVLNSSPGWTPGKQRNKPVKVSYVFPINFVLQ
jgi:protein TonB